MEISDTDLITPTDAAKTVVGVDSETFLDWYLSETDRPQPVVVNGKAYFRRDEIESWTDRVYKEMYAAMDREYEKFLAAQEGSIVVGT